MEEKVYKVSEVAEILQVHKETVYEIIRQNKLKCLRIGKVIRVPHLYLEEFINQ